MKAGWIKAGIAGVLLANGHAGELRVAAAASLAEAVTAVAAAYHKENGGKVTPVFAGSNVLARQIEQGAPVDVFISADEATMEALEEKKLVRDITPLLTNSLVIMVPADSPAKLTAAEDLSGMKRIAIGDPAAVPAGIYAKAWLTKQGLWEALEGKFVGSESVRAALAVVAAGNVDAAIAYRTDAANSPKVKIAFSVPAGDGPSIVYPLAVCTATRNGDEATRFTRFLRSEAAGVIFTEHGFGLVKP